MLEEGSLLLTSLESDDAQVYVPQSPPRNHCTFLQRVSLNSRLETDKDEERPMLRHCPSGVHTWREDVSAPANVSLSRAFLLSLFPSHFSFLLFLAVSLFLSFLRSLSFSPFFPLSRSLSVSFFPLAHSLSLSAYRHLSLSLSLALSHTISQARKQAQERGAAEEGGFLGLGE